MWVKYDKNSGFTLLEFLIVIALSSMVILGVYQGYFILKNTVTTYYQNIRLQNNIKSVSHEFYRIADKAGKFGCASAAQKTYLHWSKTLDLASKYLLYEHHKPLLNTSVLKQNDSRLKSILPSSLHIKLKPDSDILYIVYASDKKNKSKNKVKIKIYADCQDIFFLSEKDNIEYLYQHGQYDYVGELSVDYYFVALSKRLNNQSQSIYSLYYYNNILGLQEVAEGVESLTLGLTKEKIKHIKILINSVEGNPPIKKWFTVAI